MGFWDVIGAPFKLVGKGLDTVGGIANAGVGAVSGIGQAGIGAVGGVANTIASTPGQIVGAAANTVSGVANTFGQTVGGVAQVAGGAIQNGQNAFAGLGRDLGGNFQRSFVGGLGEVRGAADDVSGNLILPLSIGAGALAIMFFMQLQSQNSAFRR